MFTRGNNIIYKGFITDDETNEIQIISTCLREIKITFVLSGSMICGRLLNRRKNVFAPLALTTEFIVKNNLALTVQSHSKLHATVSPEHQGGAVTMRSLTRRTAGKG